MNNGNGVARRKVLLAGAIGNFVEWYDWGLYSLFATTIAPVFFPKFSPTAALLSTFAIFAVGWFVRPLAGVVFGHLGDKVGRRATLVWSVMLMSAGTLALGLLPGYAQIGIAAPALLVLCRLVQGFSAGGEATGGGIFVVEHAPYSMRGLYASLSPATSNVATVFGIFVGLMVTSATTPEQLASWGWRVPFLAAAPMALVGLYLRLRVDESPVFIAVRTEGRIESAPVVHALRVAKKPMLILMGWTMTYAVAYLLMGTFLLSYLTVTVKFSKTESLVVYMVIMLVGMLGGVAAGRLIDVVGRKRVAVVSALGVGIWAVPTFMLLARSTLLEACLVAGVLAFFAGGIATTNSLAVVELFPARVRYSASTLAYQICFALFGGTTPYAATWLVGRGHVLGPGYYLASLCVISAIVAAVGIGNRARADSGLVIQKSKESAEQASA